MEPFNSEYLPEIESALRASRKAAMRRVFITALIGIPLSILVGFWLGNTESDYWVDRLTAWSYPLTILGWSLAIILPQFYLLSKRFNIEKIMTALRQPNRIKWVWKAQRRLFRGPTRTAVHLGMDNRDLFRIIMGPEASEKVYQELCRVAPQAFWGYDYEFHKLYRKDVDAALQMDIAVEQARKKAKGEEIERMDWNMGS